MNYFLIHSLHIPFKHFRKITERPIFLLHFKEKFQRRIIYCALLSRNNVFRGQGTYDFIELISKLCHITLYVCLKHKNKQKNKCDIG